MSALCTNLLSGLSSLYECSDAGAYLRVHTPMIYPDGDLIEVYCRHRVGMIHVTDAGETLNWLLSNTMSTDLSKSQYGMISRTASLHGVDFANGCLEAYCNESNLAQAVNQIAQAAARVSDVSFTFKPRARASAADRVAAYFDEHRIQYERAVSLESDTGHQYTIDFMTHVEGVDSLIAVLGASSHDSARPMFHRVLATWYELANTKSVQSNRISLFDDSDDVWLPRDMDGLRRLSRIARWSRPSEVLNAVYGRAA